jgi:gliding motility-associated-like protein
VSDTLRVVPGQLNGDISADRITGYAPLTVTFLNNSYYTTTNGAANSSITTVWSFGNGSTGRTNAASEQTTTVYSQPGTYTTVAYVFAGASGLCVDTVKTIIQVEVPSRLNIPNIFSPNGDGVNDILFLGSDNLSTITAEIYDRWGHKVYELTTEKGNIAWDGKNQYGKEVPDGTYLYIIRATGRDSKEYDTKGTITLVR